MTSSLKVDIDPAVGRQVQELARALGVLDKSVAARFRTMVAQEFTAPLIGAARRRAGAAGARGGRLVSTYRAASRGSLPAVRIGATSVPYWSGAEFGGRSGVRRPQVQTVVFGRRVAPHVVYRRQTMQFKEHLGREGYVFFPAWRAESERLNRSLADAVAAFAEREMGA